MTFYKKITNYLSNDIRIKKYYIFDKPIFEKISRKVNGLQKTISKRISFSKSFNPHIYIYIYKKIYTPPLPPFYLKVNRITDDTFMYIQRWVDVAIIYGADIYFICDKKELETLILQKIYFRNARSINFIKSDIKSIKKEINLKNISSKVWYKAAYAHYTSFFHAKKNNIKEFWNIDADDTMFFEKPTAIVSLMKNLEKYSRENNKEIMSLDMHVSASDSKCWTYGITFTRNPENFICKSKKINNFDWVKNYYEMTAGQSNIDLFTQYLKDCGDKTIGSFYFENTHFVHLAGHLLDIRHLFYHWKEGFIYMPIILYFFQDQTIGKIPISTECKKICLDSIEDIIDYSFYFTFDVYLRKKEIYEHYLTLRKEKINAK